ncbi:NADH-quinone oxidoreductase subunit A [Paenibacillus sp. TRM 82003]|uniref:NADH-quinone oxidoreductase subunit A n=1 Tax=Kineococcus sp. TRM81007 TaxID=2925831 RepID=UPI001F571781|nr:NADH-quinone oxidoreductase subunit A [Kineococcus sp. TRM81007]MCI2237282.1 NADH-quinone oxidoreductase subunit A [Kineococcus sp. TRM81007]MCI3919341.1 NADH-quinone oxidoreductase subunit A [Paenibacillus sp. TRM 82003]
MGAYAGPLSMLLVALAGIGGLHLLARVTAVVPDPVQDLPFLSGHDPTEHALSRFHVRWYPVTLVFLAFDVEMLFMYPWAVVVADVGAGAVVEMFVFLGVLLAGVLWAWREGALRWV